MHIIYIFYCPGQPFDSRLKSCQAVVSGLPDTNFQVLKYLCSFLDQVQCMYNFMYIQSIIMYSIGAQIALHCQYVVLVEFYLNLPWFHSFCCKCENIPSPPPPHTQVADHGTVNKMTASNLAIVFGPNLIWSTNEVASLMHLGEINSFTVLLIEHYDKVFVK